MRSELDMISRQLMSTVMLWQRIICAPRPQKVSMLSAVEANGGLVGRGTIS